MAVWGLALWTLAASGASAAAIARTRLAPDDRPDALTQLQNELDALLRVGTHRPYGLAWSELPEPELRLGGGAAGAGGVGGAGRAAPVVSYLPGHTPAAGLLLHLAGQLLDRDGRDAGLRERGRRYQDAALLVARGIQAAMDANGRVPTAATFATTGLSAREAYGAVPTRSASTASLGFLLTLERDQPTDPRLTSTVTRLGNWLLRQPLRPGVFPVAGEIPGTRLQKRIVRLDLPDTRDGVVSLLLLSLPPLADGRSLPAGESPATLRPPAGGVPAGSGPPAPDAAAEAVAPVPPTTRTATRFAEAGRAAERVIQQLIRLRQSDLDRPSRYLWFPAFEMDGTVITRLPELPPTGHLLASRYALQALLAYHLVTGSAEVLDVARLSAQALEARRGPDGLFPLVDDPQRRFAPPAAISGNGLESLTPVWPRGEWGIPAVLRTTADLRVLGHRSFLVVTGRALPLHVALAAMLTGLTDELPTADWPITRAQIAVFWAGRADWRRQVEGPEPLELALRVRRLWLLYLLARWELELP